mgnify:CR=1 FL=1
MDGLRIGQRIPHGRGLSIVELLGCFTAMAGGIVLGSMYLGVDVKEMAYVVLEQAQLVDPRRGAAYGEALPDEPGAPEASTSSVDAATPTAAPAASTTPAPLHSAESADPAAASGQSGDAPVAEPAAPRKAASFFAREDLLTDQQRKALTLAYWEAVDGAMRDELGARSPTLGSDGGWQLFDYLTGRKDGHQRSASAIAALDGRGVDPHVLGYAKKARTWHEDGVSLFGRAVALLTDAPNAKLSGPFAQSWQSASTQHRMEERLLAEKHAAVASYLTHAYPDGSDDAAAP